MRKTIIIGLTALAVISCSSGKDALTGKWKFVESGFIDMGKECMDSAQVTVYLTFSKNGKLSFSGDIQPASMDYEYSPKKSLLEFAGETRNVSISNDGKTLEISYEKYMDVVKDNIILVERYKKEE